MQEEINELNAKVRGYKKYDHVIKKYESLLKETSDIAIVAQADINELLEKIKLLKNEIKKIDQEKSQVHR